jgi:Nucleotidyl transferase AbiEii toxin, Type IV TA system
VPRPARLTSLPRNFEIGLHLLERGHAIRKGGNLAPSDLPKRVLRLLNRFDDEGIDWVLVGAEAMNIYRKRPRATVDVDIVVRKKHLRKARKVLLEECEEVRESEVHYKAVLVSEPVPLDVDVIKSQAHELFDEALDRKTVLEGVKLPRIEVLLALKYLSVVSLWRSRGDKLQDAADFTHVFKDNQDQIDRGLLCDLASRAWKGGRSEFEKFLEAIETGGPLTI